MSRSVLVASQYLRCGRDRVTTILMTICLAIPFATLLTVVAGAQAFWWRYQHPRTALMSEVVYLLYAAVAVCLTVIPTLSMSAAVARLGLSRRVQQLAVMRLIGMSAKEVKGASLIDTLRIALGGLAGGTVLYLVTMPLWQRVEFQDAPLQWGEMWIGVLWWALCALVTMTIVAASAWLALRPLEVSPLGVARRSERSGISKLWILVILLVLCAWIFVLRALMSAEQVVAIGVGMLMLSLFFALTNVAGVLTIALGGRLMVWAARRPATLLAARRIVDNPRVQWRSYGGMTLVAFIVAVLLPVFSVISTDFSGSDNKVMAHDISVGVLIVFAFTFLLGAVSTVANQSARILDSAPELRALIRLGARPADLDRARRWEVLMPMVMTVIAAFMMGLAFSAPLTFQATRPQALAPAFGLLFAGIAVVAVVGESTRWWQQQVLRR